ncbi:ABC transporter permease [Ancylomarina euxinus]|uniref:ABC transporter permease n=1 Tax=Ancylomarina euxinus TaxID=2283627 RepID=A0A425Y822_9BACT|nr:ABC transporter permease [Ancylomarina euxinus]MCZ4693406.1 ABC transporter permease [Ancylomarina euxinus]MUP13633.1 FtsX-like permease family protein [Ancylomarina euxinus]RRG24725.1 ABC transporter permease [Ancylomarina euxinus]
MFDRDKWNEIFSTIRKNKTRTFLTGFSVATGIFMLIFLLGAGRGLRNGMKDVFAQDATNSMQIYGGRTTKAYKGTPEGKRIQMKNADLLSLKKSIEKMDAISAMSYIPGAEVISYKDNFGNFNVSPIHDTYQEITNFDILKGRFLNKKDIKGYRKVVIIQDEVEKVLFPKEAAIGKYININKIKFKVVGVFSKKDFDGNSRDIYIPITVAQKIFNNNDHVRRISFTLNDVSLEESKEIEKQITYQMAARHNFSREDKNALWIQNSIEQSKGFADLFSGIEKFVWIIGVFTILLGVIGVFNIMMIVVKERTKEIGIRKAIGASPISVVSLVLMEAIFITAASGYVGLIAGVGLLETISKFNLIEKLYPPAAIYFLNPQVDMGIAIGATIVLVITGALAGFFPARRAASIRPIEALRDE